MESLQITAGFSEIKLQLIKKRGLKKSPHELDLWFSLENDVLYVHDFEKHEDCMVIAIWERGEVTCYLSGRNYDRDVFNLALKINQEQNTDVAMELNGLYGLHGFRRRRRS